MLYTLAIHSHPLLSIIELKFLAVLFEIILVVSQLHNAKIIMKKGTLITSLLLLQSYRDLPILIYSHICLLNTKIPLIIAVNSQDDPGDLLKT